MNISLNWLGDFLTGATDPEAAGDALMRGGLPVEKIERLADDTILDVEVTSNRSDCLSHVGIARELAAMQKRDFTDVNIVAAEVAMPVTQLTSVKIEAPDLCPHYTARVIRGVKIGPSPAWMVKRLEAIGLRSINNVVDVTNYVMFELGQPLHAFDFDKLQGGKIVVRRAKAGETITSIDGHERKLLPDVLVIADAHRPVALAGVMGGLDSEVSGNTVNVLLESARFDPLSVRRTARALAMKSDSSYRFERGIDPTLADRASRRAAQLIMETAGGELLAGAAVAGEANFKPKNATVRMTRLRQLLGMDVSLDEAMDALRRLQLSPQATSDSIAVTIPSWRLDLSVEVDLIEEIARVVGYERIPINRQIRIELTPPDPRANAMEIVRSTLVAAGYFEAVTFTFVSDALAAAFLPEDSAALPRADAAVRKADARLRPSILPGLLEAVRRNETNGTEEAMLFEAGSTFATDSDGKIFEHRRLGLIGGKSLRSVRGVIESMLTRLDAGKQLRVIPDARRGYAAGACGRLEWGGVNVGYLGRIEPTIADQLSLRHVPAAAELMIEPLLIGTQHVPQLAALPRFPAVRRDVSLVVAESTPYAAVDALIEKLKLASLESAEYVTTYRGKPLEKGTKSVTTTLIFRSPTGTLTSEAIEPQVQRFIENAAAELRATLRTLSWTTFISQGGS